jgi:hypothetical protein
MAVAINDGFDNIQRPDSTQGVDVQFSHVQFGVVTRIATGSNAAFVKLPLLNENAEVGPFPCLQPFTNAVSTPVRQTLDVTTGTVDSTTVVTAVSLSSTTTSINGVYGTLNLPAVNDRVLVVLVNGSLDDGVIVGKL